MASRIAVRKTYKLYLGGAFPRTESGRYLPVTDAKGVFVANICRASRKDFRNAVAAARKAQGPWSARTAFNRGQILYRMAEMLESRRDAFVAALISFGGASKRDARDEVDASIDRLVWYAGWADKFSQLFSSVNPVSAPFFNFSTPEPTGVVTVICPPTAPLLGLVSTIAPVIVSGNSCIAIVDNDAPTLAIDLAEVLATSDLPAGVVNILTGEVDELLPHIAAHRDVNAVWAFGLGPEARTTLESTAADSMKRVKVSDDPAGMKWLDEDMQSPYWILPFTETKTAWHPVGF